MEKMEKWKGKVREFEAGEKLPILENDAFGGKLSVLVEPPWPRGYAIGGFRSKFSAEHGC